jgi:hypothetical protein
MPVGSVGKWFVLGALVASLGAGGCKEEDEVDGSGNTDAGPKVDAGGGGGTDAGQTADAGPKDAGNATDSAVDSGPVDAGNVMCGTLTCMPYSPSPGLVPPFAAGCTVDHQDAAVCGLSTASLLDGGEPKFLQKDAPGVASMPCGMFYDNLEPTPDGGAVDGGAKGDGKINTTVMLLGMTVTLTYPGCCTAKGFCSGDTSKGTTSLGTMSNGGYGCMDNNVMFRTVPEAYRAIRCDTTSGNLVDAGAGGGDGGSDAGPSDAGADGGNG